MYSLFYHLQTGEATPLCMTIEQLIHCHHSIYVVRILIWSNDDVIDFNFKLRYLKKWTIEQLIHKLSIPPPCVFV